MYGQGNPPGGFGPPGGGGYGPPGGGGYGPPPGGGYGPPPGGGYGPPGGGGYGPPGGAPPGGAPPGGAPPGGAPPGGGGYGPPPGGGYGPPGGALPGGGYGPPPGGGYVPPPGGAPPPGGFGGPPQGGFGGPPPGGFGGPPLPPSSSGGGKNGLIAGLGIGCLVLVVVVSFGVYSTIKKTKRVANAIASAVATSGIQVDGVPNAGKGQIKLEFKNGQTFKGKTGSTLHLVGELANVGTDSVARPSAKVTLLDASGTAVDSGSCIAAGVRSLPAGESVPCYGLFTKTASYASHKVETQGFPDYQNLQLAKLDMADGTMNEPTNVYSPYKVTGKVTNQSTFTAKSVWIAVGLYDEAGKLCGAGQGAVAGNDLDAGAAARFEVSIYNVSAKPKRFEAKAFGYDK
ncbi:MAG: hypothetical protein FJ095_18950 [Deltaproteobacteria bacterium]|nr:hypothetical protein [Deltaproteobacteria bacterium]